MAQRNPILLGAPVLLVSIIGCLAIGEAASRALHLSRTWTSYIAGREMNLAATLTRESVGFRRIAGTKFPMPFNQTFTINAAGFRDREFTLANPRGAIRVAFLGDSVMEGYAVDADARMSEVARAAVAASHGGVYETLNFGVAGHSTADQFVVLRDHALRYEPRIVVVQVGWNDFADNVRKLPLVDGSGIHPDVPAVLARPEPQRGVKGFLQAHSAFYLTIAERYSLFRLRRGGPNALLDRVLATTEDEWASTARLLRLIVDATQARGARVVVTYVPLDVEVQAARDEDARVASEQIGAMCRAMPGTVCVDALTPLRAHRDETLFVDDAHLSTAGHRLLGAELAAALIAATR
jgi:lysophospholipase L1-like esterase